MRPRSVGRRGRARPQSGILSPLLANLALSDLDNHFAEAWQQTSATRVDRARRHRHGLATYRLVRHTDDFVIMVNGTRAHAQALHAEVAAVLAGIGLRLAPDKTGIAHIDDGFDLPGFHIQRQHKRGDGRRYVYTYPSKKALASVTRKIKTITRQGTNQPLSKILEQLGSALRGSTTYFRHAVSNATFGYLRHYTWTRVLIWLRNKHRRATWKSLRRRYTIRGWWPEHDGIRLFDPAAVTITRYSYRGDRIPTPWTPAPRPGDACWRERVEPDAVKSQVRFGGGRWKRASREVAPRRGRPHLAGDALDRCRRRIQQIIHGHRGRKEDPLYRARRILHTGADLLTNKQKDRLADLSATVDPSRSRRPGAPTSA